MKKLSTYIVILFSLAVYSVNAQTCEDDSRLSKVGPLVKMIKNGGEIEPPLQLTVNSFLKMNGKLRGFLGGGEDFPNFKVLNANCEEIAFFGGNATETVELPFVEIFSKIEKLQKSNPEWIKNYVQMVTAEPKTAKQIIELTFAAPYKFDQRTICQLTDYGIIGMGHLPNDERGIVAQAYYDNSCQQDDQGAFIGYYQQPFAIELFAGLGGKSTKPLTQSLYIYNSSGNGSGSEKYSSLPVNKKYKAYRSGYRSHFQYKDDNNLTAQINYQSRYDDTTVRRLLALHKLSTKLEIVSNLERFESIERGPEFRDDRFGFWKEDGEAISGVMESIKQQNKVQEEFLAEDSIVIDSEKE